MKETSRSIETARAERPVPRDKTGRYRLICSPPAASRVVAEEFGRRAARRIMAGALPRDPFEPHALAVVAGLACAAGRRGRIARVDSTGVAAAEPPLSKEVPGRGG